MLLLVCLLSAPSVAKEQSSKEQSSIEVYGIGDSKADVIYRGGEIVSLDETYSAKGKEFKSYPGIKFEVVGAVFNNRTAEANWVEADQPVEFNLLRDAKDWANARGAIGKLVDEPISVSGCVGTVVCADNIGVAVIQIDNTSKMTLAILGNRSQTEDLISDFEIF